MKINIFEAKTNFSGLIKLLETGAEKEIVVARYGDPVVKILMYDNVFVSRRIGIAKGKINLDITINQYLSRNKENGGCL